MQELDGKTHPICQIEVYGQSQDASESRYLLGNQFLKGYYVGLNYTGEGHIGFNGDYKDITFYVKPQDPVPAAPIDPIIVILVIGGILFFVSVGICVCIKKKNEQLQYQLEAQTADNKLDY